MNNEINWIIGCETSGVTREAFRKFGINCWSVDILPSDNNSKFHIQDDILKVLKMDFVKNVRGGIFHPPCTYLTNSANKWYKEQPKRKSGTLVGKERLQAREEAVEFFMKLWNSNIYRIAIENPIGIMNSRLFKPQVIQPYMFGHLETKATCLWLKNLPKLIPTTDLKEQTLSLPEKERMKLHYLSKTDERWKLRSKTFQGIGDAFAEQWHNL